VTDANSLAAEKAFAQRRAGLLASDHAADAAYLDGLFIGAPDPDRHGVSLQPRPLSNAERDAVLQGKPGLRGRIVRKDQLVQEAQKETLVQRLRARRRAEAAAREAAKLAQEAARFGDG